MQRCLLLLLFPLVAGCGNQTAEVTGEVTFAGEPLSKGTIIFETKNARPAVGQILNGKIIKVTTFKEGDGVPPGEHKVAIQSVAEAGSAVVSNPGEGGIPKNYMGGKSLIPTVYGDPETSGLTATIKAGQVNKLEFKLKKNPNAK